MTASELRVLAIRYGKTAYGRYLQQLIEDPMGATVKEP